MSSSGILYNITELVALIVAREHSAFINRVNFNFQLFIYLCQPIYHHFKWCATHL